MSLIQANDMKKREEILLATVNQVAKNRADWAERVVGPIAAKAMSDAVLKNALGCFTVLRSAKTFEGLGEGPLYRRSGRHAVNVVNGRTSPDAHAVCGPDVSGDVLYGHTINVTGVKEVTGELFFTVAILDDLEAMIKDERTPEAFRLSFSAARGYGWNHVRHKRTKHMQFPGPDADIEQWLETQISVHFQFWLESALDDDAYFEASSSYNKFMVFPEDDQ